jgi:serine/threonine-protein kinase
MEFPHRRGEFSVLQKIGEGGMAEVFLAERGGDSGFSSRVALKRLHASFGDDQYFIRQLVQEAKLLGQLQHNNIVRVHDLRKLDDEYFIVMEYIDGLDLAQAIYVHKEHSLGVPLSVFFHVALSLCEALEFAHTALDLEGRPIQLIHRDIKPSNVLIHHRGVVKLTDFGIAHVADSNNTGSVVKGTANYMSPEQAGGEQKLTPASDIFSLGAVFWELLTLDRLVDGTNYLNVIHSIREINVGLKEISSRGIEPGLRMILLRMLARKRELRYQNMGLVLKDLRFVAEQMKVDLSPSHLREYMSKITNLARGESLHNDPTLVGKVKGSPELQDERPITAEVRRAAEVAEVVLPSAAALMTPPRGQPLGAARTDVYPTGRDASDVGPSEAETSEIEVEPGLELSDRPTKELALQPAAAPSRAGSGPPRRRVGTATKKRRPPIAYVGLVVVALLLAAAVGGLVSVLLVDGR